jgi:hypothetical protein
MKFTSVIVLCCLIFTIPVAIAFGKDPCVISDSEEYAVFAAVLFPQTPDVPDNLTDKLQRDAYLSLNTVHLDGFHGSSYTLHQEAAPVKQPIPKKYGVTRSGLETCNIESKRLLALIPEGKRIAFIGAEEMRKTFSNREGKNDGWSDFRKHSPLAGGIAYLSRPAFDYTKNKAVIDAHFQADYEMGVGYRVYLEKSPKSGKWILTGADLTRRS